MSFDFSTLITDRTQSDVTALKKLLSKPYSGWTDEEKAQFSLASSKGAYNYTDLNRVSSAVYALDEMLRGFGYKTGVEKISVPHPQEDVVVSRLPDGYTELEYIQSSGTQYIDTGFKPNQNTRIICDYVLVSIGSTAVALFGARIAYQNTAFGYWAAGNSSAASIQDDYYSLINPYTATVINVRATVDKNKNTTTNSVLGYSKSFEAAAFQSDFALFLFAYNTNGKKDNQVGSIRMYSCQIYDNDTLILDYVPCKNETGTIGLYDVSNGVFYENAGTGSFTAGPEVEQPVIPQPSEDYDEYTWYEVDIPDSETMGKYLENLSKLRSVIIAPASTPAIPSDMNGLTVTEANNIEKIIADLNQLLINMSLAWFYSGELYAGEV